MKSITQISFLAQSSVSNDLTRAVVRQLGGWKAFKESAPDIARQGIDGGFHGFIYHNETVKFAEDNLDDILALAERHCEEIGYEDVFIMFSCFSCMNGFTPSEIARAIYSTHNSDDRVTVYNALAWYAAEEVAGEYYQSIEE